MWKQAQHDLLDSIGIFYQCIVRRETDSSSQERVYPWTVVLPQFAKAQSLLSRSRKTRTDQTRSGQHTLKPVFNTYFPIKVQKGLAAHLAWHTTSAELGSHQPHLLVVRERYHQAAGHSQYGTIRERSVGLFLVAGCRGLQCPLRRFHAPVHL